MKNILVMEPRRDGVYALFSGMEVVENYRLTRHESLEDAITAYAEVLKQDTEPVFVADSFDSGFRKTVRTALYRNGVSKNHVCVDYREAFVYYRLTFNRNPSMYDFVLMHQTGDFLEVYEAEPDVSIKPCKIRVSKRCIENAGFADFPGPEKDAVLSEIARQELQPRMKMLFLTGEAFQGGFMSDSLSVLCSGRLVFLEADLFILGAWAYRKYYETDAFRNTYCIRTAFTPGIRLTVPVRTRVGETAYVLIRDDAHSYDSLRSVEVIASTEEYLEVHCAFPEEEGRNEETVRLYIGHLVRGINRPTRLRVTAGLMDDGRSYLISAEDIGFGSLVRASHMRVCRYVTWRKEETHE